MSVNRVNVTKIHNDILQINAEDIVIIGDGPAALLTAIKLKQKGVANVTVIGPRLGEFTRSGDYVGGVFDDISRSIAPLEVKPSKGRHIKDIERQLYEHAKHLGINLVKKKFKEFSAKKQLVLIDSQNLLSKIDADIVFDCTGTKREVLTKFNERPGIVKFNFTDVGKDHPHKFYALVRTEMSLYETTYFLKSFHYKFNPVTYAIAMEELRKLGWKSYAIPHAYATPEAQSLNVSSKKTNFYLQIPEGLSKEDIVKFAKITLWLYQDDPLAKRYPDLKLHKESRKYSEKKTVSNFTIDSHQTNPAYYLGDEDCPMILHQGDATANLPFLAGQGLRRGIARINAGMDTLIIHNGRIHEINLKKYEDTLKEELEIHATAVEGTIIRAKERMEIWQDKNKVMQFYREAEKLCQDTNDKALISKGLLALQQECALENHVTAKKSILNL